jgi:hypothetical protein
MNRLLALSAILVFLAGSVAQAKVVQQLGIGIQSCVVNKGGGGLTNGVNVVFLNTHASAATEVDFSVTYQSHHAVFVDRGSFTKYATINHNLTDGLVGYPWNGPKPTLCTVRRVVLSNGKVLTL